MTKQKKSGKKTSGGRSSLDTSKVQTLDGRRGMSVTTRFIGMLVAIACVFLLMYIQDYHRAEKSVASATVSTQDVVVEKGDAAMVFRPVQGGDTGLIFYPGSKVQHTAYAPLMQMLAQRGVFCVLVEMPFRLPLLDRSAAGVYPADYPEIKNWFLGGHSLGGNVAADYAAKHPEELTGLVLLGAYASKDLSGSNLPVLSIVGEFDTVIDRDKLEQNRIYLPQSAQELTISGGNHAGFGSYGKQDKDGQATITAAEQQEQTAQLIASWMSSLQGE